jgi:hypothetical protein
VKNYFHNPSWLNLAQRMQSMNLILPSSTVFTD